MARGAIFSLFSGVCKSGYHFIVSTGFDVLIEDSVSFYS